METKKIKVDDSPLLYSGFSQEKEEKSMIVMDMDGYFELEDTVDDAVFLYMA